MRAGKTVMKVTLFTITYNQCDIVVQTLRDAMAQCYESELLDIVILDDGSSDGTTAALTAVATGARQHVTVLTGEHTNDYRNAGLWNRCIAASAADTEVFIQVDDVRLRPDFIEQHLKWHRGPGMHVVTGAKFEGPEENWSLATCRRHALAGADGAAALNVPATAIWGASLSYPAAALAAVCTRPEERPYDEAMTGYGHHEVELAVRLQKAGVRTVYDPQAGVFHRDHDRAAEARRGLDRARLVQDGFTKNADYICRKHGLQQLPRW